MTSDLRGKVALVTGAARGIGQAIADRFAMNGAVVYYTDLALEEAQAAAQKSPLGRALKLDVTSPTDIASAMERLVAECGRLDVLVNNAGVNTMAHRVTIDAFPREEWDRILAVDLTGVYEMSRAAAAVMRSQKAGRIINVAQSRASCRCGCSVRSSRPRRAWSTSRGRWRSNSARTAS
jgi:NAD(P)-dependent dehydrogenase (short-subunit alcohol dehydrogenase family)